jgi:hypothetical protein
MGIQAAKIEGHWNYFLAIERDVEVLSRYVEFDKQNFKCFSIEIARILIAAGAEVDVVCRQMCRAKNPNSEADNIREYRDEITLAIPQIPDFQVLVPRFGLTLQPWNEWRSNARAPLWWTAYNMIKHHRDSEYHRASLKNALNAVAGLFVVVLYLYEEKARSGELLPSPQLLTVSDTYNGGFIIGGAPVYRI